MPRDLFEEAGITSATQPRDLFAEAGINPTEPSALDKVGREAGLMARATKNLANLPGLIMDIPSRLVNATGAAIQDFNTSPEDEVSQDLRGGYRPAAANSPLPSQMANETINQGMDAAGLPTPNTPGERIRSDIYGGLLGAKQIMGGTAADSVMRSAPALQYLSSVTGAGAGGAVREAGGNIWAQIAASVLAGASPSAAYYGTPAAIRGAFRGGSEGAQNMRNNIDSFAAAGTTPTLGQATEARVPQFTESLLTKTPGSGGVMVGKANQQADDIARSLEGKAAALAPRTTATTTGRIIDKGITGDNGFVEQFKKSQGELYDKLDAHIPLSTPIDVSNIKAAIGKVNQDIPGAPNVAEYFKNAKIAGIGNAIDKDTQNILAGYGNVGNTLPYEAVKKLRTLIGNEMANNSIVSDVPNSKWKALYAGLSQDMEQAANNSGSEAKNAWNRANNYTRAGMERIELLNGIVGKDTPEKVFQAAISGTREGATNLRAVMRSLPDDGKKAVTATVIRRLGLANPGNQNELSDAFSTNTFLTNWSKLSPEARQTLFGSHGAEFQNDMNQVAKVASNLRKGTKVFANPSGTEQALSARSTVGGIVLAAATGHPTVAAGLASGAATANLYSRLMINPNFIKWLAQNSQKPAAALPSALNNLSQWAAKNNDQDALNISEMLKQTGDTNKQQ